MVIFFLSVDKIKFYFLFIPVKFYFNLITNPLPRLSALSFKQARLMKKKQTQKTFLRKGERERDSK